MAIRLKVQEDKVTLKVGQGEGATLNAVREERPILVNDYDDLINKPSINGVELEGDLTTEDLHIEAGVTSWNGQTGDVVYTPPEVPVQSVNGETGDVILNAADVGALPDDTTYVGSVSVTPDLTSGTKVGSIDIDGTSTDLYAPTNTDTKVTQTATTTTDYTYWRGLCVGNSAVQSESGAFSTVTDAVRTFNNIRVQPSSGTIKATTFKGNLTGDVTGTASGNLKTGDSVGNLVNDMGYVTLYDVLNASANIMILSVYDPSETTSTCALIDAEQVPVSLTQLLNAQTKQGKVFVLEPLNASNTIFRVYNFEYGNMSGNVVLSCEAEGYRYEAILTDSGSGLVGTWTKTQIVVPSDIPTKTSDLTNDSGFVNSAQAASAAPVQSVNGQTGAVTVDTMPSATGEADGTALVAVDGVWTKQAGYGYKATETGELANYTLTTTAFEPAVIQNAFEPSIGSEYTVVYDGVTYTLTAIADTVQGYGDAIYFGNGQLFGLTGGDPNAPFVYGFILAMQAGGFVTATSGDHTIVINGDKVVRHNFTLDYVPIENVAGVVQHKGSTDYLGTIGSIRAQNGVSYGFNSTAFGDSFSGGDNAFAEGRGSAFGDYSHAEGYQTTANMANAHAEGFQSVASGDAAHAEGQGTAASGSRAHAEGVFSTASGAYSHAEGYNSEASNDSAHAEGRYTAATGTYSHAEGFQTDATGIASHSEGFYTIAKGYSQHAGGKYNIQDDNNTYAEIIGNGTTENARSNARTLDWNGNEWVAGSMTAAGGFVGNVTGTASGNLPSSTTYAASPTVGGSATFANGIHYGRVDNTSTSTAFTATIPGISSYYDGLTIILYNGKVTSASGFTININGLGAYGTYSNMSLGNEHTPTAPTRDTTIFNVNYAMIFTYCSDIGGQGITGWICYRGYDVNTNTIGYQIRTNSYSLPMTKKVYRYRLLFTSADGEHFVPANGSTSTNATSARTACQDPINPFGSIVYYGTTAAVDVRSRPSVTNLWQEYTLNLGYSFQKSPNYSMTAWKPVYLKCSPQSDGSAIIDSTDPIVQDLPTTEDGFIYIFLGVAYSTTSIELNLVHPVYYYKGGSVRLWTNADSGTSAQTQTATLTTAGWSNNSQTVNVSGVTASNTVIVSAAPSSTPDYASAGVYCSAQGSGTLTFTCAATPPSALTVNVVILN